MEKDENPDKLNIGGGSYITRLSKKFRSRKPYKPADPKKVLSSIPATVVDILVKKGQQVKKDDVLMILDAMKMQNRLRSPLDGIVRKIYVKKGDKVSKGTLLLEFS